MIHYLCFGLVKYFLILFLSSSVAFSRTSPPSVRAEEGVTMPLFVLFCFLRLFLLLLLLSSLTPIPGCCESEGAIKKETQSSQP